MPKYGLINSTQTMPKYGLITCFSPVMKAQLLVTLTNISSMEPKAKNRDLENGKKAVFWAIQKVAKTGNIGKKKSSGRRYRLCSIYLD